MHCETGQRISDYILDEKIGQGAFGEVWRAHHHVWADDRVAVKIPTDAAYIRDLQCEGTVVRAMQHPNIVRALGIDPYADPAYFIMELVPGTSLRPLIAQKKLSPQQAVAILRQVLTGLAVAHAAEIVHRDIKPENILIHESAAASVYTAPGCVKIADFGLGRSAAREMAGSIRVSQDESRDERLVGTLDYMAPEQRHGGPVDARADLYSCGVLLYEMLTGELPEGHEVPSGINADSPAYLDDVFRKAYGKLEHRYANAADFLQALNPPLVAPARRIIPVPNPPAKTPVSSTDAMSRFTNSLGMTFVYIAPGSFMMGSPETEEARELDESLHPMTVDRPFMMAITTVTQKQWKGVMRTDPSAHKGDELPVENVSWNDAVEFCRRLSEREGERYRLPTEAEWEYACRAGSSTPFHFGETLCADEANYNSTFTYGHGHKGEYRQATIAAAGLEPNAWGLHQMHGNVWEWCQDAYGEYDVDGVVSAGGEADANTPRVLRGGSWSDLPRDCRSAFRFRASAEDRGDNIGLRICIEL